jgi:AAA domain, putative AbiEii toxin, Type IV TA system
MGKEWKWSGARWWKFDLHAHTPSSANDYGKGPDIKTLSHLPPVEWLQSYMKAEIDAVAITDHNCGTAIDPLKQKYKAMADAQVPGYRPLVLFPGVELSVNGGVHIIVVFDRDKSSHDIDSFLGAVGYRGTKGNTEECTELSLAEVLRQVARSGALAIPAHVDGPCGLFTTFSGPTLAQALDAPELFAMELVDPKAKLPQDYISHKLSWTALFSSDSHHPYGTPYPDCPGSRFTWLKMAEPSLEGIRLCLLDGEISARAWFDVANDPNSFAPKVIEGIQIEKAKFLGRDRPYVCSLNPWLNAFIGGRGTGKSTVLEFMRNALQRGDELSGDLREELSKYRKVSAARMDDGLLLSDTSLALFYRKDGARFRLSWNPTAPQSSKIEEESDSGEWSESQGDVAQRFPVRLYSQKQIFELARSPFALLRIVDDSSEVGFDEWRQHWDELTSKYLSLRAQQRERQASVAEEAAIKGQLEDVKRKLHVFESSGHADVLQSYQQGAKQKKELDDWQETWSNLPDRIEEIVGGIAPRALDDDIFPSKSAEYAELLGEVKRVQEGAEQIAAELRQVGSKARSLVESWKTKRPQLAIEGKIAEGTKKYNDLLARLSAAGAGAPTEYATLVFLAQELEGKLEGIGQKRKEIDDFAHQAETCAQEIQKHRDYLSARRKAFLESVLSGNPFVRIEVARYGNASEAVDSFRALIGRENGFERDVGSPDSDTGLIADLYRDDGQSLASRLSRLKVAVGKMCDGQDAVVQDRRFLAHMKSLPPEIVDRIRFWYPEDSLEIAYCAEKGGQFRPIQQGSPGQKTAALLAFLLSYGDDPLVLDQPEDDLDNNLIYELIVSQLRASKQKRQIIVVTHNANIVVNGDAENLMVLGIERGQSKTVAQGSLQETKIRDQICSVMEGGKEAFDLRYKRIRVSLGS